MSQQLQSFQPFGSWRGGRGERLWLSRLVDTMEQVSQPSRRIEPCDKEVILALRAQLALAAGARFTSPFSFRN
jgi:hypothetical protein